MSHGSTLFIAGETDVWWGWGQRRPCRGAVRPSWIDHPEQKVSRYIKSFIHSFVKQLCEEMVESVTKI